MRCLCIELVALSTTSSPNALSLAQQSQGTSFGVVSHVHQNTAIVGTPRVITPRRASSRLRNTVLRTVLQTIL